MSLRQTLVFLAAAVVIFLSGSARSASFSNSAIGTTGAAFLGTPTSARIQAMGEISAATSQGAEAIFLNPAGLTTLSDEASSLNPKKDSPIDPFGQFASAQTPTRSELSLDYSSLLQTTYAGAGSYAYSLGPDGVLAAGFLYFSQAPQTAYDALGNAQGSFTPYDLAFSVAYARVIQDVRVGADAKLIQSQIIEGTSGQTEAVDLGAEMTDLGDVSQGPIDIGAYVSNLGPGLKVGTTASPLPTNIRAGFFWHLYPIFGFGMDANFPANEDPYLDIGSEWKYQQPSWSAALRAGYDQGVGHQGLGNFSGFAAGAGLSWKNFTVDYAWAPFSNLGMTDRVSLAFRF